MKENKDEFDEDELDEDSVEKTSQSEWDKSEAEFEKGKKKDEDVEEEDEEHPKTKKKKKRHKAPIIFVLIFVAVVAVFGLNNKFKFFPSIFSESGGENVIKETSTTITEVVTTSEFNTIEWPLKSFAEVDADEDGTVDYYVAYDGKVKVGLDISKIQVSEPDENNVITITLPKLEPTDYNVENVEAIIINTSYTHESIIDDERDEACSDLLKKAEENNDIIDSATENAKSFEKQLAESILNAKGLENNYTINVVAEGDK